jgi:hypothetical protein
MAATNKKWIIFQLFLVGLPFIISSGIRLYLMNDFSLFILDFSSISFSFSLSSFIIAKNVSGYKNPVPNEDQDKENYDWYFCIVLGILFFTTFIAIECFQTQVMTNLSVKEKIPLYVFIGVTVILIAWFLYFSSNLRKDYKLKITF